MTHPEGLSDSRLRRGPAFILGAGFNADASATVEGQVVRYPLLADLLQECFGLPTTPAGQSVEDLFQSALDSKPLERLAEILMKADHYLSACCLKNTSPYSKFLTVFPTAPILTFNYDGLLEILSGKLGAWRPEDGFGVEVRANLPPLENLVRSLPRFSTRPILHLHGALYVYAKEHEVVEGALDGVDQLRGRPGGPLFVFDPDRNAAEFLFFQRPAPDLLYIHPPLRVIAPVPDKSEGLRQAFSKSMYQRAHSVLAEAPAVAVIGYGFNPSDSASYESLLNVLSRKRKPVVIVDPAAESLAGRLSEQYPDICWRPVAYKFAEWVESGYRGILPCNH